MKNALYTLLPALVAAGPGINPNPNPNFDPSTSQGTLGPFIIPQAPSAAAVGGPASVDPRTAQAMQLAISNWQTDTGIVSLFQNQGPVTQDNTAFQGIADGAFKAEVDELSQKAVLDAVIGNDPRVSLANLTLTNGVFQSVVDNLQIMSIQGTAKVNLVDAINQVRCTQILPSIDTYMVVAAEYIGANAQQRRAVRPNACAGILAAAQPSDIPAVPGTPLGTPKGTGDGNVSGVPPACGQGQGNPPQNVAPTTGGTGTTGTGGKKGKTNGGTTAGNSTSNAANSPLPNVTTPQLGGIIGGGASSVPAVPAASASTPATGGGKGKTNGGTGGNAGNTNAQSSAAASAPAKASASAPAKASATAAAAAGGKTGGKKTGAKGILKGLGGGRPRKGRVQTDAGCP